jgi:PAS domain-containing protein
MRQGAADYLVKTRDYLDLLPRVLDRAIKEQKLSSQLKLSEQRYFALFDRASIAIFIAQTENQKLIQVNKNATELLHCSSADLIGRDWREIFSLRSRQQVDQFFHKLLNELQADSNETYPGTLRPPSDPR